MRPSNGPAIPRSPSPLPLILTIALILTTAPVSLGQGSTGTISGKVTVENTGEAVAGARVLLYRSDHDQILVGSFTGRDGAYRIENVPPGRYTLTVSAESYRPVRVEDVLVTIGLTTSQTFQLAERGETVSERGVIRGTVVDQATGAPIAAVNIVLYQDGRPTRWGAFTDEAGEYVIINVPPGRYTLRAAMVGYKVVEVENLLVTTDRVTRQAFKLEKR